MSWLGNVIKFENFNLGNQWEKLKKNPERAFIGAMDEGGTKVWNKVFDWTAPVTGIQRNYEPMTDYFGGASKDSYTKANAAGINTGPGKSMHNVAKAITAAYVGGYGAGQAGFGGGGVGGGSEAINPATGVGWSETGSGLAGNSGYAGGSSGGFGLNPSMGAGVTSNSFGTTTGSSYGSLNPTMGNGVTSTGYGTTSGGDFGLYAGSPSGIQSTQSSAGLGDLSASGNSSSNNSMFNRKLLSQALRNMPSSGQKQQQSQLEIIEGQPAFIEQNQGSLPIQSEMPKTPNYYGIDQFQLAQELRNS
jgi:hypothetical protein